MKQITVLLVLGFALSLCNLSNKLKNTDKSGQPGKSSSTSSDTDIEHATPTAAQTGALAGGQTVKWDQQGMSWTVPPKWTQADNDSKMLVWRSPGGSDAANLIVNISAMDESFPPTLASRHFSMARRREPGMAKWMKSSGSKSMA